MVHVKIMGTVNLVPMRSKRRLRGLSHGNNTAALPPMLLGDFETAQQAQNAVMAFQPPQPQLAEHWHGNQRTI